MWLPAEEDFTLSNHDSWFYNERAGVRTPAELRTMYERSSGGNTGLIINIGPFANGSVPPDQVAAATTLGTYVRHCYDPGKAVASGASKVGTSNASVTIAPPKPTAVDRVQIREEQSRGQLVREFELTATLANGTNVVLCPDRASSIGNKFICVMEAPLVVASLSLSVKAAVAGTTPRINQFAAFYCSEVVRELDAAVIPTI
eukprot:SAG25_NODE_728_length_5697_cov_2.400322_2_plen_202_part_00